MSETDADNIISHKGKPAFHRSLLYPLIFVTVIWIIKIIEVSFGYSFSAYGVFPQSISGLKGIAFSPLIHGDFSHLFSNTIPLLILGSMLFYFYRAIAFKVVIIGWIVSGFWLWIIGREAYHIGASSLIYFMASFLFVSGIIRKHTGLMAISLVVAFLYGSIIWGIFPLKEKMSWEGHLSGLVAGIVLAFFYKKQGPQRKIYQWELEEDEDDDDDEDTGYFDRNKQYFYSYKEK